MKISQVSNSFVPHDAISNDIRGIRSLLFDIGENHIVSNSVTPELLGEVLTSAAYDVHFGGVGSHDDLLLHHHSIGNGPLHNWLMRRHERLVIKYHNITPAKYFVDDAPIVALQLDEGRRELNELVGRSVGAIADSEYNRAELVALGMDPSVVKVVPPFLDPGLFIGSPPYRAENRAPRLLYVGQLFPHKRVELLVAVYALIVTHIDPTVTLDIVGPTRLGVFGSVIKSLRRRFATPGVTFHDRLSADELSSLFDQASMCVTLSEHEGFCVPAVESMVRGVPFLCRDIAALPGTVGTGGIVVPEDLGAFELAEVIAAVLADAGLRQGWSDAGSLWAQRYTAANNNVAFLEALSEFI